MHVLMTADTVGGVWTYTQELVSQLIQQGIRVTLVSLGKLPSPQQSAWIDALPELDYRPTDYRLEWMQDSERDVEESGNYLESVIREVRPDLLHLNQNCYTRPGFGVVVYNGRDPARFDPDRPKKDFILSVGRLWDKAKQVALLLQRDQAIPVCIAGSGEEPGKDVGCENEPTIKNQQLKGSQSPEQLRGLFADAAIYAATSCYEPFGLAPLEAALSGCALVAND